jgi:sarcosine dehydrogenase
MHIPVTPYSLTQAGIGFTVLPKLKKGETDFLGRAALEAQRTAGVRRKLVCLQLDPGETMLNGLETIWRDGACIGYVRSQAYGHTLGATVAYGYVERDAKITKKWLEAGAWEIGDKGDKHQATLQIKAAFDPSNSRIKGEYA